MKEILFSIDKADTIGLQMQLKRQLVDAILSRALQPDERLPSSRKLATYLDISRNTVTLVYQDLVDSGYLVSNSRSGFRVRVDAPLDEIGVQGLTAQSVDKARTDATITFEDRLQTELAVPALEGNPLNWREYEYPFVYGQMDFNLFNHSQWRDCTRQATGARDFGFLAGDFANKDDPLLVNLIASHSLARRGVVAKPEEVLVTLGAQNALFLIAELLIGAQTRVVVENPCYPDLMEIVARKTDRISSLDVDDDGIVLDETMLSSCDLVFVTPSHQCPTAVTMSLERRKELLKLASIHDFLIVEDDYEFEMNFIKNASPALKSMDSEGRVIYVGSFSKSLFPGLRLGFLSAGTEFVEQARGLRHLMLRHPPGIAQRTAAYFMAMGHYDSQINRLKRIFAKRRQTMQHSLEQMDKISGTAAGFGGTGFWVQGPSWLSSKKLAERLKEKSVLIEPGAAFFVGKNRPENYFRAAYSSIADEKIELGLQIINDEIAVLETQVSP